MEGVQKASSIYIFIYMNININVYMNLLVYIHIHVSPSTYTHICIVSPSVCMFRFCYFTFNCFFPANIGQLVPASCSYLLNESFANKIASDPGNFLFMNVSTHLIRFVPHWHGRILEYFVNSFVLCTASWLKADMVSLI